MTSKEHQESREAHLMQQYATEKRSGATELSYQDWKKQRGVEQIRIIPSLIRVILKDN